MCCVVAKDEEKKDAALAPSGGSSSMLNLAGIASVNKEKRQHTAVSVYDCTLGL